MFLKFIVQFRFITPFLTTKKNPVKYLLLIKLGNLFLINNSDSHQRDLNELTLLSKDRTY